MHHFNTLSLKAFFSVFLLLFVWLSSPAYGNECLRFQKQLSASHPFFSFINIDHEEFDNIREINEEIAELKVDENLDLEYWAGNFKHFLGLSSVIPGGSIDLRTWFYEGDDGTFFIERSFSKDTNDNISAVFQTFKVGAECKRKLVNTKKLSFYLNDNRMVETSYIDGAVEVETVEVEAMPKEFGLLSAKEILKAQGTRKTSAFLSLRMPYSEVTISDTYREENLLDMLVRRDVLVKCKHLLYEYKNLGNMDVDVYVSPLSFYKKIVLNGFGLKDKFFERVRRDMWEQSSLSLFRTNVSYRTTLKRMKGTEDVESYKLLSNLPIKHDNLANYPYIKPFGREGEKYVYQILGNVDYKPVKSAEVPGDKYLKSTYYINTASPKIKDVIGYINKTDPLEILDNILLFVNHFILKYDDTGREEGNVRLMTTEQILEKGKGVCQHYANLVVALCRTKGIPARIIRGYALGDNSSVDHAWVEAYVNNTWLPLDPQASLLSQSRVSNRYIPILVWEDYESMTNTNNIKSSLRFVEYQIAVDDLVLDE